MGREEVAPTLIETELGTPDSQPQVHLGTLLMVSQGVMDSSGFRTYV